jgi:hypothetical protein
MPLILPWHCVQPCKRRCTNEGASGGSLTLPNERPFASGLRRRGRERLYRRTSWRHQTSCGVDVMAIVFRNMRCRLRTTWLPGADLPEPRLHSPWRSPLLHVGSWRYTFQDPLDARSDAPRFDRHQQGRMTPRGGPPAGAPASRTCTSTTCGARPVRAGLRAACSCRRSETGSGTRASARRRRISSPR